MAGTGVIGILITFVGGPILIAVLATILIVRYKRKVERTSDPFPQVIQDAAVAAVPETEGYERIQSGYDSLPNYIICYRGDEMYIMAAKYSSRKRIDVDKDVILHFTKDQVQRIKLGLGKVDIIFKDKQFFVAGVGPQVIAPQTEQYEAFMKYIKNLAAEVNH